MQPASVIPGAALQVFLQSVLRDQGAKAPTPAAAASQPQPSTQPHALTGRQQPRSAASNSPAACQASGEVLLPDRGGGQPSGGSARASQASEEVPAPAGGSGHRTRSIAGAGQAFQGGLAPARGGGQQSRAGAGERSRGGLSEVSASCVVMPRHFTNRGTAETPGQQAGHAGQHINAVAAQLWSAGCRLSTGRQSAYSAFQVSLFPPGGSNASLRPPSPAPEGAARARGEHCTACVDPHDCLSLPRPCTALHRPFMAAAGSRAKHSAAAAGDPWVPHRCLCSHGIERAWETLETQPV